MDGPNMDRMSPDNPLADVTRSRPGVRTERTDVAPDPERGDLPRRRPRRLPQHASIETAAQQGVNLRGMLGSRDALRQAIILAEIVGPPKALRQDD